MKYLLAAALFATVAACAEKPLPADRPTTENYVDIPSEACQRNPEDCR